MFEYCFTFRSVTAAQYGHRVLTDAVIDAALMRAPKALSERGCGYCLMVSGANGIRAASALRRMDAQVARVYRMTRGGMAEEVFL